ncbi:hypothetical protein XBFM1_220004 [Xenorhabdus bovienii str. feltiae Moldova]|uniref:Uncharacterized protein n=2 Tax=Xenorhabdus bovienii TaxID=40576 RepID=A0A077PP33_XENBV|nr:hypothetical protein XBFM1_220004 [Xenorhabdus bovienii str. feltiae Moldova]CDH22312.1 hypothetical protein XBKB1_1070006 [Xenorhabdus bovienii str. kraussei Becker Underwood]
MENSMCFAMNQPLIILEILGKASHV